MKVFCINNLKEVKYEASWLDCYEKQFSSDICRITLNLECDIFGVYLVLNGYCGKCLTLCGFKCVDNIEMKEKVVSPLYFFY